MPSGPALLSRLHGSVRYVPQPVTTDRSGTDAPASRLLIVHSSSERYGSDLACLHIAVAAQSRWQVDVIVPSPGPLVDRLRQHGVAVTILDPIVLRHADLRGPGALVMPFRWAAGALKLKSFLRRRARYDVVHSNCAPTLGGALLARWSRARHVWYVHEIFASARQRRLFDALLRRSADAVLACSSAALEQFPGVVSTGIGTVVYTGVEVPERTCVGARSSTDLPVVVCVGRLNAWKGQAVLIEAVSQLRAQGVDFRVELVGSYFRDQQQFETQLRSQVARLALADRVEFLGERDDVFEIVGRADVLVLPSTRPEPFGMALVEAMGLGLPVIATAAGGPAEIIEDGVNGLLVPMGDAVALADAIRRLLADSAFARRLGAQAKIKAADFSSTRMTALVLDCYADLLAKGAR